jgi:Fe2+ transport system protein B
MHMLKIRHLYKPNITCRILSDKNILKESQQYKKIIEHIEQNIDILLESKDIIYNNKFECIEKDFTEFKNTMKNYFKEVGTEIEKIKQEHKSHNTESNTGMLIFSIFLIMCFYFTWYINIDKTITENIDKKINDMLVRY